MTRLIVSVRKKWRGVVGKEGMKLKIYVECKRLIISATKNDHLNILQIQIKYTFADSIVKIFCFFLL